MSAPVRVSSLALAALLLGTLSMLPRLACAQADIGVSIGFAQPGMYGRIDIGNVVSPPPVLYAQPMVIQQGVYAAPPQPIYLRVPPGHERHWDRHCHEYNACGVPVYFVREDWYREHYREQERHEDEDGDRGHGHGHGRGHKHDD